MVTEMELFESTDPLSLDFCMWCWLKSEVYNNKKWWIHNTNCSLAFWMLLPA